MGPQRTEIDGINKWRYQGIMGVWNAPHNNELSADDRVQILLEKYNEINQQQTKFAKETPTQVSPGTV